MWRSFKFLNQKILPGSIGSREVGGYGRLVDEKCGQSRRISSIVRLSVPWKEDATDLKYSYYRVVANRAAIVKA